MTTDNTHTPGPWHLSGEDEGPGKHYLHIGGARGMMALASMNSSHVDTVANAHLIAAAPELLEALEGLSRAYSKLDGAQTFPGSWHSHAAAAISKARGKS